MLVDVLKTLFSRDLRRLKQEITLYQSETAMWTIDQQVSNSGGNLCLHLLGNLNTYVGRGLGGVPYERDREAEFSRKDVPRQELLTWIDQTIVVVSKALDQVDEAQLAAEYPLLVFEQTTSTEYMLVHLTTHLAYHLGQINYHRRLLDLPG